MSAKNRNFMTQKVIPESREQLDTKIQNEQVNSFQIKFEAYNHFLTMVSHNHQSLVSNYSKRLLEQHQLLLDLADPKKENVDESISEIHNNMFMLKIQNEKLKCKQKLLRQKLQCQKLLYRQRKQQTSGIEKQRRMKIEQIKLLKEQVNLLQSIVEKKKKLKVAQQKKQHAAEFVARIREIVEQESAEKMEQSLKQLLKQSQVSI